MTFQSDSNPSRRDFAADPDHDQLEGSILRGRAASLHDEPRQGQPEPHPEPRAEANAVLSADLRGALLGSLWSALMWLLPIFGWAGKMLIEIVGLLGKAVKVLQTALQLLATCVIRNPAAMDLVARGIGGIVAAAGLSLAVTHGTHVACSLACSVGSSVPILGTWLDRTWCAAPTQNDKQPPPKLASARFAIVRPTGCTTLVDADVLVQLAINAAGLNLDYQQKQAGGEVHDDQRAQTASQVTEAGRALEKINAAIEAAAKRATPMQRDLLGLLDQIALYPASDETWYQRLLGEFLGAAGTGRAAMARRVDTALGIYAKAQNGSDIILAGLQRPISMSLLCPDHVQRQKNRRDSRNAEAGSARSTRKRQKKRGSPANEAQRALADVEREQIRRLERTVVAETGEVAAKVNLVCDGVALIGQRALNLADQMEDERDAVVEAARRLRDLRQRVASWGLFASGRAIREEEHRLVGILETSLTEIARAYSPTKEQRR